MPHRLPLMDTDIEQVHDSIVHERSSKPTNRPMEMVTVIIAELSQLTD